MHDIHLLEKQWEAYNKKRKRPLYVALLALVVLLSAFYMFMIWRKNRHITSIKKASAIQLENKKSRSAMVMNKVAIEKTIDRLDIYPIKKTKKRTDDYLVSSVDSTQSNPVEVVEEIPVLKEESPSAYSSPAMSIRTIDKKKTVSKRTLPIQKRKRKKIKLKIIETTSVSAYKDVEKRFKLSHDVDDALFLARGYYRHGNYKKAEYWALQANKIDNTREDSWLIFIKSKYNMGQKSEAKHILQSYVRKSGSVAARKLMSKLK